jgi:hypothetical protein
MFMDSPQQDLDAPREPKIIFLHIPKTAGMSLRGLFIRNYRGKAQFNTRVNNFEQKDWLECLDQVRKIPREELDRYGVFKGHMIFGLHELLPGPAEYITFLRDPVKRFVSHYKMVQRHKVIPPDHQIDPSKSDWNLGAHPGLVRSLDNYQTRLLSGMDFEIPFGACTEEHVALAKANLDRHFTFVGLTEQFDLSLMLMRHVCGWGWRYYIPDNSAPGKSAEIAPVVLDAVRRLNRLDLELYRYAQERFDRLVDRYGWKLQAELKAYRLGNRLHGNLHKWRHAVKQKMGIERRPPMGPV